MTLKNAIVRCIATVFLCASVQADTLEQHIARSFIKTYKQNEARLTIIGEELQALPRPYLREPTGTGGFLSHEQKSATNEVVLTFSWENPVEVDAVALFPLRLFMDEIYGDNLYWPGSITIEALMNDETSVIARGVGGQPLIPQSLPELIEFDPVITRSLTIRCTDLPQHPYEKWHAAGFAEICIFSGSDNIAPRAALNTSSSRQGYHVLAQEFLTDAQTPLGLPELNSHSRVHAFIKKMGSKQSTPNLAYVLTCSYPQETSIDAVRIDPAIEHSYGQSFPVRFTIELLDAQGRIVQTDGTYKDFPMRPPGLNPHFSYFPKTTAQAVRLTVHEAAQPVPLATPAIAFSEITALYQGQEQTRATAFMEQFKGKNIHLAPGEPQNTEVRQMLASANDGLTHSGQVLPLRKWTADLVRRQQLTEEQMILRASQKKMLDVVQNTLIQGSLVLLLLGIGFSVFFVARNRIHSRKELHLARAKMASDLHDDVGSNLGAIVLHVEKLQETKPALAEYDRLHSILRLTRESVFGLREVLRTTAPEVGRAQDIIAYMQELAGLLLGKTDFSFRAVPSINQTLQENAALQKGLLLFYKEAIHNAKTHSQCSHVDISLHRENDALILKVKDNGKGIAKEALKKPHTLRTLKQRADWLQADLKIESVPGSGTGFTLTIAKGMQHHCRR
jgi:signal transduction histidine kinase